MLLSAIYINVYIDRIESDAEAQIRDRDGLRNFPQIRRRFANLYPNYACFFLRELTSSRRGRQSRSVCDEAGAWRSTGMGAFIDGAVPRRGSSFAFAPALSIDCPLGVTVSLPGAVLLQFG